MTTWIVINGRKRRVDLPAGSHDGALECLVDGHAISVDVQATQPSVISLLVDGRQYRCVLDGDAVLIAGQRFGFELEDPRSLQGRRGPGAGLDGPRPVKAPMPGRVVRVLVEAGEQVAEGQGVVVIEAMKMQNELRSSKSGRVARVAVVEGDSVSSGDLLVVVE